ncbi:MAG: MYXO-CTERM sorting domain-containing protein [Byssovorax sp.]
MRRLTSLTCLAAGLLCATFGSTALAGAATFTARTGRFAAGSGAIEGAAARIAGEQIPGASALSFDGGRVVSLRSGERVVKLAQVHQGLRVVDRGVAVVFGAGGEGRLVSAALEDELPASVVPAIKADDAASIAAARTGMPADPARALLALFPTPDGVKLAYGVDSAPRPGVPSMPVVIVDAASGEILSVYDAVRSLNEASVYPSNPVKSPDLVKTTLPVAADKMTLDNERVQSLTCIDKHSLKSIPGFPIKIHSCDLLQIAAPDANGDYPIPPGGDTDPEDAFAEVSMFYHVNRAYDFFRGYDDKLDVNAGTPIPTVSNLRLPDGYQTQDPSKLSDPNLPLVPFQNAFFAPENPLFSAVFGINGGAMWFGQGPLKDYSYDGDVVYHEFTHAVVNVTLKLAGTSHMDAFGASASPGAMNEGLADYFSSALTGDPDVGEYASQDFAPGSPAIRSLTAPDSCPSDVGGEVHQDATMFSASLWDVRKTLTAEQKPLYDGAIFTAMNSSPTGNLGYEDFAKLALSAIEASPLGQPISDALSAAFTARGLLPQCQRILEYKGDPLSGPKALSNLWFAPGTQTNGVKTSSGYTPGVVQVHGALPENTAKLTVGFTKVEIGGGGFGTGGTPFAPKVLVRFGSDPITFTYKPLKANEDVKVIDPMKGKAGAFTGEIDVPAGTTSVYVMIASAGQLDGAYTKLSLTTEVTQPMGTGGAGGSMTTTTTTASTTGAGGNGDGSVEVGGCGCSVPAEEHDAPAALSALAMLGLWAARRRSR